MTHSQAEPELTSIAAGWLRGGLDGIGNAGEVQGEKVRLYRGDFFTHDFKGYDAARRGLAKQFGESFADAPTPGKGVVGLVGEVNRAGQMCLMCEVFHLGTGGSTVIVQPLRKSLFRRKPAGEPEVVGPAPPLEPYIPTPPELKRLLASLKEVAEARKAANGDAARAARIEIHSYFSKRGGDDILWDFNLKISRDEKELEFWSKQIWDRSKPVVDVQEFDEWLAQQLALALTL